MDPATIAATLTRAIEDEIDLELREEVLEREERERAGLEREVKRHIEER
jgi:hypothetical protein